jgi:nucleotide sugar dehydrogenase
MSKETIGIIGQGFVGSAVREGMKNYYEVFTFDKDPNKFSSASSIFEVIENTDVTFLCVPTPMKKSGECDLGILGSALNEIAECVKALNKPGYIVVIKSTIPPGTTEMLNSIYTSLDIVFNPEFLTEANAVEDYKNQNRIIVGGERPGSTRVKAIFAKAFPKVPIIKTSSTIAETIKYVTNTFLAMKVSYANEIFQLCQGLNIDYDKVIEYARYDDRLGNSHWSVPGPDGDFGFGGHCFPKDIAALQFLANKLNVDTTMLSATIDKNNLVRTDLDWTKQIGRAVSAE